MKTLTIIIALVTFQAIAAQAAVFRGRIETVSSMPHAQIRELARENAIFECILANYPASACKSAESIEKVYLNTNIYGGPGGYVGHSVLQIGPSECK